MQVQDLAAMIATCREARSLASADLHWERLARMDLDVDEGDVEMAKRFGWMRLYKSKRLEQEAAR